MSKLPYDLFLQEYSLLCSYPELQYECYDTLLNIRDFTNENFWREFRNVLVNNDLFFHEETIDCIVRMVKERYHPKNSYVYYTSLETANAIFSNQELWLRSTTLMNDDHVLVFGKEAVDRVLHQNPIESQIDGYCKLFQADGHDDFLKKFESLYQTLRYNTYIICFSDDATEGQGKLSMWRSYAPHGLAIYFNRERLTRLSTFLSTELQGVSAEGAYTFSRMLPALYTENAAETFEFLMSKTLSQVLKNASEYKMMSDFTPRLYLDQLYDMVFYSMFLFKTKYYEEEKEYRLFLSSTKEINALNFLRRQEVNCAGTEQYVYKLSLRNIFQANYSQNSWDKLIDKIIIWGKLNNISTVANNLLLNNIASLGISSSKIEFAEIPYRSAHGKEA